MTAEDVNAYKEKSETPWNRYNKYKYFHVFYAKEKSSSAETSSQYDNKHVHIRMTRSRSETIFRRAFFGRKVEHVILDMHHALKKGTHGTIFSMYGVDVGDLKKEIHEAIKHFREQERKSKAPLQENIPWKQPHTHVGRKLSFIPPYNIPIPKGTIIPTIQPTKYVPLTSFLGPEGKIDSITSSINHTVHLGSYSGSPSTKDLLRSRYALTESGIFPHYEDPRDYRAECAVAKIKANWTTGQGMLYSYHRPF